MTSRASALAITTYLLGAAAKRARRRTRPEVGLKTKSPIEIDIHGDTYPQRSGGKKMTETYYGPGSTSGDSAVTVVDEEIRLEVLRQLNSINCDDDDWRIESLPMFEVDSSTTPAD